MGLKAQAAVDAKSFLENEGDFGVQVTVTDPSGTSANIVGYSNDIHLLVDPDTGQSVSGRQATVALSLASLTAAGLDIPRGIATSASKPWVVSTTDSEDNAYTWKVAESNPDRSLGIVVCHLQVYKQLADS